MTPRKYIACTIVADYWMSNIDTTTLLTVQHISELHKLWVMLQSVHLSEAELDAITWNLTSSGQYSVAPTYRS
jgi:hypothetical protein